MLVVRVGWKRRRQVITYLIILANVILYVITSLESGLVEVTQKWVDQLAYVPALARFPKQFYRFFTSMFLHADFFHIFFNMYFLYIFGRRVEERLGARRYLLLYLLSGLFATLFHTAFTPVTGSVGMIVPALGASGAISGVLAAYMLLYPGSRLAVWMFPFPPLILRAEYYLLLWFALQVLYGYARLESGTAFFAHAGGFVAGIILLFLLLRPRRRAERGRGTVLLAFLVALLLGGAIYSLVNVGTVSGVYTLEVHTRSGEKEEEGTAVYVRRENRMIVPPETGPRVVLNRIFWSGMLVSSPGYHEPNFVHETQVVSPEGIETYFKIWGEMRYGKTGILEAFEGEVTTEVLIYDWWGRFRGKESVHYEVSISSREETGDAAFKVVLPAATISIAVLVFSLWVVWTVGWRAAETYEIPLVPF